MSLLFPSPPGQLPRFAAPLLAVAAARPARGRWPRPAQGLRRQLQGQHRQRDRHRRRGAWSRRAGRGRARTAWRSARDGRQVYVTGDGASQHERDRHRQRPRRRSTVEVGTTPHGLALHARRQDCCWSASTATTGSPSSTPRAARVVGQRAGAPSRTRSRSVPTASSPTSPRSSPGRFALVVVDLATRARGCARSPLDKPPRDPEFSHDGKCALRHRSPASTRCR